MTTEAVHPAPTPGAITQDAIDDAKRHMRDGRSPIPITDENAWLVASGFAKSGGRSALTSDPRNTPWGDTVRARTTGMKRRLTFIGRSDAYTYFVEGRGVPTFNQMLGDFKIGRDSISVANDPQGLWRAIFGAEKFFSEGTLPDVIAMAGPLPIRNLANGGRSEPTDCTAELLALAKAWNIPFIVLPYPG